MTTVATAIALILVIEGGLYALFPGGMKRLLADVLGMPDPVLRNIGLIAGAVGLAILWLVHR